jgi:uncharacterized protein YjbI with pentapeptide repeats
MPTNYFTDLVNLKADEWNESVASKFGITTDELKQLTQSGELRSVGERIKLNISKQSIQKLSHEQDAIDKETRKLFTQGDYSIIYEPTALDKFRIRVSDGEKLTESIALTGKIVIGADLSGSDLSHSYLCGCTFYNCNFNNCNIEYSVISSCIFNNCSFIKSDLTASTISRSKFYECILDKGTYDYVTISDCIFIASTISDSTIIQSKILYTALCDCLANRCDWKDSDLIECSFTNINFSESDFKRSTVVDCLMIRCNLMKCDFNSFSVTCLTASNCKYESQYESIFDMKHSLYSPSVFEWEVESE